MIDATGAGVEWVPLPAGADAFRTLGSALPAETVAAVRELKVLLKGPMDVPDEGYPAPTRPGRGGAADHEPQSGERLARFAYTWAQDHGLERVTIGHLAPSQRATDGIFLRTALDVAREFPALTVDDEAVDPLCTHLLQDPTPYQLLLARPRRVSSPSTSAADLLTAPTRLVVSPIEC